MRNVRGLLALFLCFALIANAQGNTFRKVRYNGGSVSTTVNPDDWDNKLTVSSESIVLVLKDGQTITIIPKQVSSLSYGQEAHRRIGAAVGLAFLSLGVGALFALHKTKLHFIGINYSDKDGKKQGLLLQGDKSNFRAILVALQGVTGAPVSVAEKERSEIPAGVAVRTAVEPSENAKVAAPAGQAQSAPEAPESLAVTSNPDGAEVYVDGSLIGNAPVTLKLTAGKHTIRVSISGYKDWVREISAESGTQAHLTAALEKVD